MTDWVRRLTDGDVALPPAWELLGLRFAEVGEGAATVTMEIRPEFLNASGVVQGGLLSSLADVAMGVAVASAAESRAGATLEFKVNFCGNASDGTLRATARTLRVGNRFAHAEAEVWTSDGELAAKATSTFSLRA